MSEVLKVSGLSGGYNRLTVFRDISLNLKLGSTLGILGCNGVGKTTLLKTIAGTASLVWWKRCVPGI